jgi:hypothetical protein
MFQLQLFFLLHCDIRGIITFKWMAMISLKNEVFLLICFKSLCWTSCNNVAPVTNLCLGRATTLLNFVISGLTIWIVDTIFGGLRHQRVVRNTIFRKAPPSVVSGYGKRSINLNKVVVTFVCFKSLCWTSCNNVAPVTNLCLGRATTRSHSSQWSKKKSCS